MPLHILSVILDACTDTVTMTVCTSNGKMMTTCSYVIVTILFFCLEVTCDLVAFDCRPQGPRFESHLMLHRYNFVL